MPGPDEGPVEEEGVEPDVRVNACELSAPLVQPGVLCVEKSNLQHGERACTPQEPQRQFGKVGRAQGGRGQRGQSCADIHARAVVRGQSCVVAHLLLGFVSHVIFTAETAASDKYPLPRE